MRKNAPTTKLTKEQEAWMEKQKLYATHPIYNNSLIRKICNDFDGFSWIWCHKVLKPGYIPGGPYSTTSSSYKNLCSIPAAC